MALKTANQIDKNKLELKDGEFFMCLNDFISYFIRTDICHIIYDGYKDNVKHRKEALKVIFFLIGHYKMYGYLEQAENIRKKFFGYDYLK